MFKNIAYFLILGKPLIFYFGAFALLSLLFTALIAVLNKKGIQAIPFKWHFRMAKITIILALAHGILVASTFF